MDTSIIVALIASGVALLTSVITAINSRRAIAVQREAVLIPMQKELLNINNRQLHKIRKELKEQDRTKVDGLSTAKNNSEAKENIATIIAQTVHSLTDLLPDMIDEVFFITHREDLVKLKKTIEEVKDFKGLIQARELYGSTNRDDKLKEYQENLNPINAILKVREDFDVIIEQEILRCNEKLKERVCSFNCVNGVNDSWQIKILP